MEEKDQQSTITLPEHVVSNHILPKLPVKSLLRFKSVSKDWFSLISSTTFIKTQLKFSSSARNELLLNNNNRKFFTLSYDEQGLIELVRLSDDKVRNLGLRRRIVGCCNGLICIYIWDVPSLYFVIWNPAIRVYNKVTLPTGEFTSGVYGFGYGSVDDDYIIVCLSQSSSNVCVFSLKQGKWKIVDSRLEYVVRPNPWSGVCVDDKLFWINGRVDQQGSLLSYNLATKEFKVVPGCKDWVGRISQLYVIRGCLALRCYGRSGGGEDVRIRKRKGDTISGSWEWEKAFVITNNITRYTIYMAISETGKCLVEQSNESSVMLKLVDPTIGDSEHNKCIECKDLTGGKHYFQTLISPFANEDRKPRKQLISPFAIEDRMPRKRLKRW